MEKIKNPSGLPFWRRKKCDRSIIICIFRLREKICGELLARALSDTLVLIPHMGYSITEEDGMLYYTNADAPLELENTGSVSIPSIKKANGHFIGVSYEDDTIYFSLHHSLADGVANETFQYQLIKRYLELKNGSAKPVTTPLYDADIMDRNCDLAEITADEGYLPHRCNSEGLSLEPETASQDFVTRFVIDEDTIKSYAKENDGTISTAVYSLVAREIYKSYPETDERVVGRIVADARAPLGLDGTFNNCIWSAHLGFSEDELKCGLAKVKEELKKQICKNQVCWFFKNYSDRICVYPDEVNNPEYSFIITFTGNRFEDFADEIRDLRFFSPDDGTPKIHMRLLGGKLYFDITYIGKDNQFPDIVKRALVGIGAIITLETKNRFTLDGRFVMHE